MSNLTCPGCGSVYPLAAVQKFDRFTCAVCHQVIMVPIAGPAPGRAGPGSGAKPVPATPAPPQHTLPPPATRPAPVHHAPAHHSPHRPASTHAASTHHAPRVASHPRAAGPNWGLIGTGVAVAAAASVGLVILLDRNQPQAPAPSAAAAQKSAAPVPAIKVDPDKDPSAWKALSPSERQDRVSKYLAGLDRHSGNALSAAYTFLRARDEQDGVRRLTEMELARDPASSWAHQARGDVIISDRIERCLTECIRADEADTPGIQRLSKVRKANQRENEIWWADAAQQKEVDDLLTQIRTEEKNLQDPYNWAVAKWTIYQRRIEVMRDHPAITGTVGPYLLFVQIKAPPGTPLESVGSSEMERAKAVLEREKALFSAFYDGFHEALGKRLGLLRYDRTNLDHATVLKANIFADETTWELYHQRMGFLPFAGGTRSYYHTDEPRFLVTYDPGDAALRADSEESQCHVATFQAMHFYTWDLTRKAEGRELSWSQCHTRPLWLLQGFASFFAAHRRENGRYEWMQPSPDRMAALWIYAQVFQKKRWASWSLDELLSCTGDEQVDEQAGRRVVPRTVKEPTPQQDAERKLAVRLMTPVFYSKAWSLVSFLWNAADKSGRPKYREAFLDLLGQSFHVRQAVAEGKGLQTQVLSAADFRKALGVGAPERLAAFDREWQAWEQDLLAKEQVPSWTVRRDRVFGDLGLR